MQEVILIPQIIGNVIQKAWNNGLGTVLSTASSGTITGYNYLHGTPRELENRLTRMAKSPTSKDKQFPLVCLVHNFTEKFNDTSVYNETELYLWIMYPSLKNQTDYEVKYTDTFEPILYPIWQYIIEWVRRSGYFYIDMSEGVNHEKTDRPNWGAYVAGIGNTEAKFGTMIDGIELRLTLKLNYVNCLKAQKENRVIIN